LGWYPSPIDDVSQAIHRFVEIIRETGLYFLLNDFMRFVSLIEEDSLDCGGAHFVDRGMEVGV